MDGSNYVGSRGLEWAIKVNRYTLQMLGLWPQDVRLPKEKLKRNLHVLLILLMMIFSLLIPCIRSLIRFHQDIIIIFEHIEFIAPFTITVVKLSIFWWKKEAIIPIMNMITGNWLEMRNKQEREMMIKWAQRIRIITSCAYFIMGAAYLCFICLPYCGISPRYTMNTTNVDKFLMFPSYYKYDVTKRPQYELTYLSHVIGIFFTILSYTGIDCFLGFLVFHICGQLDILRIRLMYLDKLIKFQDYLKICVNQHVRLLRAIAAVEDMYNIMLLALFLYFEISFAFYGFLIIILVEEKDHYISTGRIIICILAVVNIFIHIGLYCSVGEILVTQCNRVYYAVCNQRWYSLDPKNAKELILLMIKCAETPNITAGKMFPMTLATFSNLMKTSAGYVSVLLTFRN